MTMMVEPNLRTWYGGYYLKKLCFIVIQFEPVCDHPVTNGLDACRELIFCSLKITIRLVGTVEEVQLDVIICGSGSHGV